MPPSSLRSVVAAAGTLPFSHTSPPPILSIWSLVQIVRYMSLLATCSPTLHHHYHMVTYQNYTNTLTTPTKRLGTVCAVPLLDGGMRMRTLRVHSTCKLEIPTLGADFNIVGIRWWKEKCLCSDSWKMRSFLQRRATRNFSLVLLRACLFLAPMWKRAMSTDACQLQCVTEITLVSIYWNHCANTRSKVEKAYNIISVYIRRRF